MPEFASASRLPPLQALAKPCAAVLSLLIISGCAAAPPPVTQSEERSLFVEASSDIIEFHINAVLPAQLAIDGLNRLSSIDPNLTVERTANEVLLQRGGDIRRFDAPAPDAVAEWGALTAKALATARSMSPAVAVIPPDRLDELVIDASLAKLDPYSRYARPEVARERRAVRDGFAGIGVTLEIQPTEVRIASVMPDTPAAEAGLKAGDRIVILDGVPVTQLAADEVRRHLRGPAQTRVQLAVARSGNPQLLDITVERANIVPESVTLKEADGIAWLRLRAFNQQTAQTLAGLMQRAHHDLGPALTGIVLDLRDNPGGLLDQSVDVVSLFLGSGDVVSTIGRNPQSQQHFVAGENGDVEKLPMVVLVNGGSASASEIVAAALQDSGRAVVVGTSSYGKGTVQTVLRTSNDGELTVTWAQLITPRGYFLNTHGVVPTVCTSGLEDSAAGATSVLAARPDPVPAALARARNTLDDNGWRDLRALCPPKREERGVEAMVARRLLADAPLYRRVLAAIGTTHVAANQ